MLQIERYGDIFGPLKNAILFSRLAGVRLRRGLGRHFRRLAITLKRRSVSLG